MARSTTSHIFRIPSRTMILMTILHAIFGIVVVLGVIFSRTPMTHAAVLAILTLIFFGIRIVRESIDNDANIPSLAEMLHALYGNDAASNVEQTVVGTLLLVHVIKIFASSILPIDVLFETEDGSERKQ